MHYTSATQRHPLESRAGATPPARGLAGWARKGYTLPVDGHVPHRLDEEFAGLPPGQQRRLGWKIWKRHAWLHLSGHARQLRPHIPATARRVLWLYTWTTLGDALMDLSASHLFPAGMDVDLHIAPQLAELLRHQPGFRRVLHGGDVPPDYDFVLLQDLHAASLRLKRRLAPRAPFASMLGYLHGEMFHRGALAHSRLGQLLGQPEAAAPAHPRLPGMPLRQYAGAIPAGVRIAVALGARDPRRRYPHWPAVIRQVLAGWPAALPPPQFVLLGNGNAHEDFAALAQASLLPCCEMRLGSPSLASLAELVASCDAFVGADGGPMHLALALQRPGVALFGPVPPDLRLLAGASLVPLGAGADLRQVAPSQIAELLLRQCAGSLKAPYSTRT